MKHNEHKTITPTPTLRVVHARLPGWNALRPRAIGSDKEPARSAKRLKRIGPLHVATLLLLLTAGLPARSQTFHLSGGYNGSNVREAGDERWVGRGGYQFGADVLIGNRLFVKPGAHYVVRNLRYTQLDAGTLAQQEYAYTSNALSVPVLLGANLIDPKDDKPFNAYLMAGPTALIDLSTKLNNNALNVTTRGTQWYLGGAGGLGYGPVFLEAGYHIALSNVFKGDDFRTNPKVNYTYVVLGLRLRFPRTD